MIIPWHKKSTQSNMKLISKFECRWLNISLGISTHIQNFLGLSVSSIHSFVHNKRKKMYVGYIRRACMYACLANAVRFIRQSNTHTHTHTSEATSNHVCMCVYVQRTTGIKTKLWSKEENSMPPSHWHHQKHIVQTHAHSNTHSLTHMYVHHAHIRGNHVCANMHTCTQTVTHTAKHKHSLHSAMIQRQHTRTHMTVCVCVCTDLTGENIAAN